MTRFALLLLCVSLWGCTATDRLMRRASAIPTWEAVYTPTTGDSFAGPYQALTARLIAHGIRVEEVPDLYQPATGAKVAGLTFRRSRLIQVEATYDLNARFEILCHEAGHLFHPQWLDSTTAEVFAEIVSVRVQRFYGSKTALTVSAPYVAAYKSAFPAMRPMRVDLQKAVDALTGRATFELIR